MKKLLGKTMLAAAIFSSSIFAGVPAEAAGKQAVQESQSLSRIIDYAKSLKGTPYKSGGTTKKGFDASGYVQHVFNQNGYKLPRTSKEMYSASEKISQPQPGDLVFYATDKKKEANYVGIYLGENQFIGVSTKSGVSIQNMKSSYWKGKYLGAKRVKTPNSAIIINTLKAGDKVNGYTISSIVKGTKDNGMTTLITFKEHVTVSGHYLIQKTNADVLHFYVSNTDLTKLPISTIGSLSNGIINFRDQESVQKAFTNIKQGAKVKVTVKNYQIGISGKNAWVENADLVKIFK